MAATSSGTALKFPAAQHVVVAAPELTRDMACGAVEM
jgi:hypothetical protein